MDTLALIANLGLIIVLSYLVGSIPTSIIVGKVFKGIDIRNYGSGNAGGTNSFRVLGWKAGMIVVAVDIFKGFAATRWVSQINLFNAPLVMVSLTPIIAGASAIIGHCYTIFAGFRGGKGVAASAGMLIAMSPSTFLVCLVVFAAVLTTTGYVSLGSISTAVILPIYLLVRRNISPDSVSLPFLILGTAAGIFVVYTHRSNIKRLMAGKENKFEKVRIFKRK